MFLCVYERESPPVQMGCVGVLGRVSAIGSFQRARLCLFHTSKRCHRGQIDRKRAVIQVS